MKLNILERIALGGIIPREGNIITLRIIRKLQDKLSFSEEELAQYKLKNTTHPDGRVSMTWDSDFSEEEKDIEIGKNATAIVKRELMRLESQNKLSLDAITLYEKFVETVPEKKVEEKTEEKA